MKKVLFTLCTLLPAFLWSQPQIQLEPFVSGLSRPVDIANAGDARLFVVEQAGVIRIIDETGDLSPTPFLNIENTVNDSGNERGLLGLVFHPQYADNGYFYVYYTGTGGASFISRYQVSDFNPNIADSSSGEVLLTFSQPASNHNGGDMAFGPDGYLYIGTGDGGGAGDTGNNAQTTSKYLGKMLRIDVDNGTPYSIPADNPFIGDPSVLDEIWAIGLRNPWRFSFDRETNDLWIADVGQESWEEIDFVPAGSGGGQNFGWRCYEGTHAYNTTDCGQFSDYYAPVFEYVSNMPTGCSVTGGFVYRGCRYPEMQGYYIFADYCSGRFWGIAPDGQGGWDDFELADLSNFEFSAFGEDYNGELYVASLASGTISRITELQEEFTVESTVSMATCEVSADGTIDLTWSGNDPQSIDWGSAGTGASLSGLEAGTYTASITTSEGCTFTYSTVVTAGELASPEIEFVSGVGLSLVSGDFASYQWYLDGTAISGATDPELNPPGTGNYSLEVTDANGCTAVSNVVQVEIVDAAEAVPVIDRLLLGPNPVQSELFYQIQLNEATGLIITISDLEGRELRNEQYSAPAGTFSGHLELSKLAAGNYILTIRTDVGQLGHSIIKL